jgi:hypothetical protein
VRRGYLIVVVTCAWPARCWMYTIELPAAASYVRDVCRASCNGRKPRRDPPSPMIPARVRARPEVVPRHLAPIEWRTELGVAEDVICEPPNSEPREGKQLCVTLPNNWCASLRVPIPLEGCAGDAGIPFNERSPPVQGIGERRYERVPDHVIESGVNIDALEDEHDLSR